MVVDGYLLVGLSALTELPLQVTNDGFLLSVAAFVVGLYGLWRGAWRFRMSQLIKNTPTETARSVSMGRTELEGNAVPDEYVFDRPFSEGKCLYAEYEIEERQSSGTGRNRTNSWKTIYQNTVVAPFYVDDGTGQILVDADQGTTVSVSDEHSATYNSETGAIQEFFGGERTGISAALRDVVGGVSDVISGETDDQSQAETDEERGRYEVDERSEITHVPRAQLNQQTVVPGVTDAGGSSPGKLLNAMRNFNIRGITGSGGVSGGSFSRRRYSEEYIPVGEDIYVFGGAEPRAAAIEASNAERVQVAEDPSTGELLVSDRDEEGTATSYFRWGLIFIFGGLALSAAGLYGILTILGI